MRFKAQIAAEEDHYMILEAIRDSAGVGAWIHFELIRDAVVIQAFLQFGGIPA